MCAITSGSMQSNKNSAQYVKNSTGMSEASLFAIESVLRSSGGFAPCFIYRGVVRNCGGCPRASPVVGPEDQFCTDGCNLNEGRRLTLYIGYEEPSPKFKRFCPALAPYRFSIADGDDALLSHERGLAQELQVDETLRLALWGSSLAMLFPTSEDLRVFVWSLRRVDIKYSSLTSHPVSELIFSKVMPSAPVVLTTPAGTVTATESLSCKIDHDRDLGSDAESSIPQDLRHKEGKAFTPALSSVTTASP